MKKNLYFASVYKSTRALEAHALSATLRFLSFPRTLLDMFIRKNLGERYIGMTQAILLVIGLGYLGYGLAPMFYIKDAQNAFHNRMRDNGYNYNPSWERENNFADGLDSFILVHFGTWYLFLLVFLYMAIVRYREMKRLPSVFDFGRSSVYTGDIHPFFINFKWKNKSLDIRQIEIVLEPLFCLIIGIGLIILQQYVGYIIVIASIGYSLNARVCYYQGDHLIMDFIDEQLYNQEKDNAFVKGDEINNARGVRYYGRRPSNQADRQKLADQFNDDEIAEAN